MRRPLATSVTLALALAVTGCGKADEQGGGGGGDGAVGPGVTDDTITLGALVDLTAVFAANSRSILEGSNLYWDAVNADGGVCGRQVELQVQDHQYDPQTAVSLYRTMSGDVLAIPHLMGGSIITALLPTIEEDNMVVGQAAWTSDALNPNVVTTGATYDVEAINAIDWLTREQGLSEGDSIGMIHFEGDYGENSLVGAEYAAEELGLTVVAQQVTPGDTDLSAQVSQFQSAGVSAILVAGASPQTASVASVAASVGLDVPIVGNSPSFSPQLLGTPAAPALAANFYTSSSIAPPSLGEGRVTEFLTAYQEEYPDQQPIQNGAMFGYATAGIFHEALEQSCDDLTREGLIDALRSMDAYDPEGTVAGTLDYSDPAVPPTRTTYISRVDPNVPGGLTLVGEAFASQLAEDYTFEG